MKMEILENARPRAVMIRDFDERTVYFSVVAFRHVEGQ
jgi:hypothetical protein